MKTNQIFQVDLVKTLFQSKQSSTYDMRKWTEIFQCSCRSIKRCSAALCLLRNGEQGIANKCEALQLTMFGVTNGCIGGEKVNAKCVVGVFFLSSSAGTADEAMAARFFAFSLHCLRCRCLYNAFNVGNACRLGQSLHLIISSSFVQKRRCWDSPRDSVTPQRGHWNDSFTKWNRATCLRRDSLFLKVFSQFAASQAIRSSDIFAQRCAFVA